MNQESRQVSVHHFFTGNSLQGKELLLKLCHVITRPDTSSALGWPCGLRLMAGGRGLLKRGTACFRSCISRTPRLIGRQAESQLVAWSWPTVGVRNMQKQNQHLKFHKNQYMYITCICCPPFGRQIFAVIDWLFHKKRSTDYKTQRPRWDIDQKVLPWLLWQHRTALILHMKSARSVKSEFHLQFTPNIGIHIGLFCEGWWFLVHLHQNCVKQYESEYGQTLSSLSSH